MMRRVPSIVSIDATQDAVIEHAASSVERWTYRPNAAIDGAVLRSAFAVVSTSDWAAGCLRRRYPDCDTPIHVMPPPVRLRFFDESWIDERRARAASGEKPRVLFIGGDFGRKGGHDLLAAWTERELHRVAALDLVTDWPVNVSRASGVRVIRGVESYSAAWSEIWRRADIFAMPTRSEAFGQVFSEAAAAGLPVVATAVNAIPEQVAHGETGLVVPPGDRRALGEALSTLIGSADLRRRLGRAGRAHARQVCDPDEYRRKVRSLIQAAALRFGGPEGPPYVRE
jgi:glycosyltransferase involved in cell wall biosynthesis